MADSTSLDEELDIPLAKLTFSKGKKKRKKQREKIAKKTKKIQKDEFAKITQRSKEEHMEFQRKVEQHERCVDKQLAANGCQRIKVKKDGDCFFTAVCMQLDSASTITPDIGEICSFIIS